jgi:hypothetical protein
VIKAKAVTLNVAARIRGPSSSAGFETGGGIPEAMVVQLSLFLPTGMMDQDGERAEKQEQIGSGEGRADEYQRNTTIVAAALLVN